jgi:predicted dienelactone hydrolase
MHTAPTRPAPGGTQQGRQGRQGRQRRCWPLAVTGLALLAASVVMMAAGAHSSRAQQDGTVTQLLEKVVRVRVADTRFVLDELTALNAGRDPGTGSPPLPAGLAGALDLNRIGMFGVSGGGFTAAQAMYEDPRIKAGIDIDGTLEYTQNPTGKHLSPVAAHGLNRPFMRFVTRATSGP